MAASLSMKVDILKKAMNPFKCWLDSCDQLVMELPQELEKADCAHLGELYLKYKDLLLQMKERCGYMQKVSNLCMEVETEAESLVAFPDSGRKMSMGQIPELTAEEEENDDDDALVVLPKRSISSDMNPKLIELAKEVKDMNARFVATCIEAKEHYTSLSQVLTASLQQQSFSSSQHSKEKNLSDDKDVRDPPEILPRSRVMSVGDCLERHTKKREDKRHHQRGMSFNLPVKLNTSHDTAGVDKATTAHANEQEDLANRKQGADDIPVASVLAPDLLNSVTLQRKPSPSTSTDLDKEQLLGAGSPSSDIVVLRSKSVSRINYSDSYPRQKRRPISALIFQQKGSQVELRHDWSHSNSFEPICAQIPDSVLSQSQNIPPLNLSSPLTIVRRPRSNFESLSSLQLKDRSSFMSIGSLDPIMMLGSEVKQGHFQNQSFEASTVSDITCSTTQIPDCVLKQGFGEWRGVVGVDNRLGLGKQSMSVDNLAFEKKKVMTLVVRLSEITLQLQEFIHKIAENRVCTLQSLDLELQLGQLKAMCSLLEFQDLELTHYSAVYSPTSREKLKSKAKTKRLSILEQTPAEMFSDAEINNCRAEITKVTDRIALLRTHCGDAIEQTEEVLVIVCQYEKEIKVFKESLDRHTATMAEIKKDSIGYTEAGWKTLSKAFSDMTEQKSQFQSICEISNHLLYLEPIFNGNSIRDDVVVLKKKFQGVVQDLFAQLEIQAKSWTEQLLLDMSVTGSWITETELSMQALSLKSKKPNGVTSKLMETRSSLLQEVMKRMTTLEETSDKLEPVCLVLKSETYQPLLDLMRQLDKHMKDLELIQVGLQDIDVNPKILDRKTNMDQYLLGGIPGRRTHDKIHDPIPMVTSRTKSLDKNYEDDNPYAEIDSLKRHVLDKRGPSFSGSVSVVPGPQCGMRPLRSPRNLFTLPEQAWTTGNTTAKATPTGLYQRMEELIPSPLVDHDLLTNNLDSAIENLPHQQHFHHSPKSSFNATPTASPTPSHYKSPSRLKPAKPKRIRYTEIDVSFYDNPKLKFYSGEGCSAVNLADGERPRKRKRKRQLHEDILVFVSREWKELDVEVIELGALDSIGETIPDAEVRSMFEEFVHSLRETDSHLKTCEEEMALLKPPVLPDLEGVHTSIDRCQKLRERVHALHSRVEDHNRRCLEVTARLHDVLPLEEKALQLLALFVFDVSMLWHVAHMHGASRMKDLRESEAHINSLHRGLRTLTRMMDEVKGFLEEAAAVLDVENYLKMSQGVFTKLMDQSDRKLNLAANVRESIKTDVQSPVSQELLTQLEQAEKVWVEVLEELPRLPSLRPLLVRQLLRNASQETESLGPCLQSLKEERSLELDEARKNKQKCKKHVLKFRQLEQSLIYAEQRLQGYISSPPERTNQVASMVQTLLIDSMRAKPVKQGEVATVEDEGKVDYKGLLGECTSVRESSKQILLELDDVLSKLGSDTKLLSTFRKEREELSIWLSDTKSMLEVTTTSSYSSSSQAGVVGVTLSPSQLRDKQQAICQQVVARKPKMQALHTLVAELVLIPAKSSDRQRLEDLTSELCTDWDELCQQCVPAGILPLITTPTGVGGTLGFQPPGDFDNVSQMLEWLVQIESRIYPVKLTVGDFGCLKKMLRDSHRIEKELKSREVDYKKYTNGMDPDVASTLDPDMELSVSSSAEMTTPNIPSSKMVKFNDENTLEREHRQQEIMKNLTECVDSSLESSGLDSNSLPTLNSVPYHAAGPHRDSHLPNAHGLEPNLNSTVAQSRILSLMASVPRCSLNQFLYHMDSSSISAISEDHYHLMLLWKGIWMMLTRERSRLESIKERWKNFEAKKEDFCKFLFRSEERIASFFRVIASTKNLAVMQTEMMTQKTFDSDMLVNKQNLSVLNFLSQDLITHFHQNDDTDDLKDTMADLNQRWIKMEEKYLLHQSSVASMMTRWAEFYHEYQSFERCSQRLDTEMSNLNPFVSDMDAVKAQLDKLKNVQQELESRDRSVECIRILVNSLIEGVGGSNLNAEAIHAKLAHMTKLWKHLHTLSAERKSALEQALSEKQDFLSLLADCLAWLDQAEKHLKNQRPLGSDSTVVANQLRVHKMFWLDVTAQMTRMKTVVVSGCHMMEQHWPQGTSEGLKSRCSGVENRWKWVLSEAEDWGKLLEDVLPEMTKFKLLCSECGQMLAEAESTMDKFDSVALKLSVLKRQLLALQGFDCAIANIGEKLGCLVNSQKRQLDLGVRKSVELVQLVKKYYHRWNCLTSSAEKRRTDIEAAMVKYDPANLGVTFLPKGWVRKMSEHNVPYFINTNSYNEVQWSHPDLLPLYLRIRREHILLSYPTPVYPVALRLRAVQKRTQMSLLYTRIVIEAYKEHIHQTNSPDTSTHNLSPYEATVLAVDIYQRLEEVIGNGGTFLSPGVGRENQKLFINGAVELTTSWARDLFDPDHKGAVKCSSFLVAIIAMSSGKLEEKHRALFNVISGGTNSLSLEQLTEFLEQIVKIPQLVCEEEFCSLHVLDVCARECFKKFVGVGRLQLPGFISWLQTDPIPLSWISVLHRLAAAENSVHEVKCGVCRAASIHGFRYRCIQCGNLDMCQTCYWSGKTTKGHDKAKHFMEEYCVATKPSEEMKDFFKSVQNSFRRKKKIINPSKTLTESLAPTQVGGAVGPAAASSATNANDNRRKSWTNKRLSPPPAKMNAVRSEEYHPGRRFTVEEDLLSAWKRGRHDVGGDVAVVKNRRSYLEGDKPESSSNFVRHNDRWRSPTTKPHINHGDMEMSFNKIRETKQNLSRHLVHIKECQLKSSGSHAKPVEDKDEVVASNEDLLQQRNFELLGRMELLQKDNRRLEKCITQLKFIADMKQQNSSVFPASTFSSSPKDFSKTTPTSSRYATPNSSAHVSPNTSAHVTPNTSPSHSCCSGIHNGGSPKLPRSSPSQKINQTAGNHTHFPGDSPQEVEGQSSHKSQADRYSHLLTKSSLSVFSSADAQGLTSQTSVSGGQGNSHHHNYSNGLVAKSTSSQSHPPGLRSIDTSRVPPPLRISLNKKNTQHVERTLL